MIEIDLEGRLNVAGMDCARFQFTIRVVLGYFDV
jgi:hypothetical protein